MVSEETEGVQLSSRVYKILVILHSIAASSEQTSWRNVAGEMKIIVVYTILHAIDCYLVCRSKAWALKATHKIQESE